MALALAYPGVAGAQDCPPAAPYATYVQDMLDSCPNWSCDVTYDPADGLFPEDDPVAPWEASYSGDSYPVMRDDHLIVYGRDFSGLVGARFDRYEDDLASPQTPLYVIQADFGVQDLENFLVNVPAEGKIAAIIGATDPDDLTDPWGGVQFSLGYQADSYFVGLAGAGVGDEYAIPYPWNVDTMTYTLVVDTAGDMHLYDDSGLLLTRPFSEVGPENVPTAFTFASADLVARYGTVKYCVCHTPEQYNGEPIDTSAVAAEMVSREGRLEVTGLTEIHKTFALDEEYAWVVMDVTASELPGFDSGQFEYSARITWHIEDYDTGEQVVILQRDKEVVGLGTTPLALGWTGYYIPDPSGTMIPDPSGTMIPDPTVPSGVSIPDDTATAIPVPGVTYIPDPSGTMIPDPSGTMIPDPYDAGPLMYKATIQLLRTKITSGKVKLLGEVSTAWRPLTLMPDPAS